MKQSSFPCCSHFTWLLNIHFLVHVQRRSEDVFLATEVKCQFQRNLPNKNIRLTSVTTARVAMPLRTNNLLWNMAALPSSLLWSHASRDRGAGAMPNPHSVRGRFRAENDVLVSVALVSCRMPMPQVKAVFCLNVCVWKNTKLFFSFFSFQAFKLTITDHFFGKISREMGEEEMLQKK